MEGRNLPIVFGIGKVLLKNQRPISIQRGNFAESKCRKELEAIAFQKNKYWSLDSLKNGFAETLHQRNRAMHGVRKNKHRPKLQSLDENPATA